jgi:5-methylcytosine-specific restriction endonuclease McrA
MATSRTGTSRWKHVAAEAKRQAHRSGLTHCPRCGVRLDWTRGRTPASPEADHIVPHSKGGADELDNVRIICRHCNQSRGDEDRRGSHRRRAVEVPTMDRTGEW